jgi:hypothetical protein
LSNFEAMFLKYLTIKFEITLAVEWSRLFFC